VALDLDLQQLIATVEKGTADHPLARLQAAVGAEVELTSIADALLTHFVVAARESGASWAEIGDALGVTKQGAQQRFGVRAGDLRALIRRGPARIEVADVPWLERFTPRARRSISAAADEARRLNHEHVGTAHLLLGLLSEPQGIAVKALEVCGHEAGAVRAAVEAGLHPGAEPLKYGGSFARSATQALDLTMQEAVRLGHNYIGTEHILLGLMKQDEGPALETLRGLGLTHDRLSVTVLGLLAGQSNPG
jgi:Clp amino terminal domain, pathogenicity island component